MLLLIFSVTVCTTGLSNVISLGFNIYSHCFPHQEVLLKRAADLVEALYGMPHNNQVRVHTANLSMLVPLLSKKQFSITKGYFYHYIWNNVGYVHCELTI